MKKLLPTLLIVALAFCTAPSADAQVLLIDFGPTAPTGADLTNSPYHAASGSTASSWNVVGTGGGFGAVINGLVYGDGTAATGVTAYRGTGTLASIDFQGALGNSFTGGGTGVFSGTSPGRDGIYGPNAGTTGFRVNGLTIGTYDVYVVGWLTTGDDPRSFYADATLPGQTNSGTTSRTWNASTAAFTETATNSVTLDMAAWAEGANYVKFTVTTTSALPAISIATQNGAGARAYLNMIQIVAVPEPSTAALLLGSGLGLLMIVSRRRVERAA